MRSKAFPQAAAAAIVGLLLCTSTVSASSGQEPIQDFDLSVDGRTVPPETFIRDDKPYVSLLDVAEALGLEAVWDPINRSASVSAGRAQASNQPTAAVDPFNPVIDLQNLGLRAGLVDALSLESAGEYVSMRFELSGDKLMIKNEAAASVGEPVLAMNVAYTLKIYTKDGSGCRISFNTAGLPPLTNTGQRRVVLVPAMPEKGFYWPYFLVLPSSKCQEENEGHKRYLVVDTNNTGSSNSVAQMLADTREDVEGMGQLSMQVAEELWSPFLMPAFPRPSIGYEYGGECNLFCTHALDRDSAALHVKMKDPALAAILNREIQDAGFEPKTLLQIDRQLEAMIDHAISYLNQYGYNVESKVFMVGYSASGTFTDRFTALHPSRVKAVASGATLDDMMLPLAEYGGEKLIFPIGTGDYQEITGRPFDLAAHNQVARLICMGEDDTNNTLPYSDGYGDNERRIITRLWGTEVLPRAKQLTALYGQAGGKGIFILDKGEEHGYSSTMREYAKTFLKANRDTDEPVYPIPDDPVQLKYTLFQ